MAAKTKYKNFESALERLEEITARLESGEALLEESIALYTEGVEIAGYCSQKLSDAEKKISVMKSKNGNLVEVPFSDGQEDSDNNEEKDAD
jgi:exodeoxyribonuclease VII small subunit